jgi:hypothetical protein
MAFPRWLLLPVLVTLSAATFAACSDGESPMASTASSTSTSTSAGGMSGVGGAGGAPATTAATGTGGSAPDAGPLVCKNHSYSSIKQGPCDLLQQDCPSGQTCKETLANGAWTTECVFSHGLKGEGEKCNYDEECLEKLSCGAGRCAPVCCQTSNEPCLGGLCDLLIQFDQTNKNNKRVCHYAKVCALMTEDACEVGFRCHIEDKKQGLATCIIASPGKVIDDLGDCHFLNECGDMEHCQNPTGFIPGKCHYYCYLDQVNPFSPGAGLGGCPAGQTCQSGTLDGAPVDLGIPNIGLCAPGG